MTSLVVVTLPGSRYLGFSNWHTGSVVAAYRAQLLQAHADPSGPGMERVSSIGRPVLNHWTTGKSSSGFNSGQIKAPGDSASQEGRGCAPCLCRSPGLLESEADLSLP